MKRKRELDDNEPQQNGKEQEIEDGGTFLIEDWWFLLLTCQARRTPRESETP